jgi:hypothetical protein
MTKSTTNKTKGIKKMSTEFKPKDRVSINKDLPYTTPRFGAVKAMREILTGTVKHNPYQQDDEVDVMLDYPDDVPEGNRIAYSYDPRDLTLISREFKPKDKVSIDKNLTYTKSRFGTAKYMEKYFTGTVSSVYGKDNDERVYVNLKSNENNTVVGCYMYDPRDLTLISEEPKPKKKGMPILDSRNFPTPTNVKTSKNKTTVEFSDNTTTSVTKSSGDPYDLETAIAYCIAKKIVTNSCIKHLAKNAEEVLDKVNVEFYNKFLKPYGFLNEKAYTDVEIETLKNYLKTLNDVRADLALIAIENDLTKDELFNKLKG